LQYFAALVDFFIWLLKLFYAVGTDFQLNWMPVFNPESSKKPLDDFGPSVFGLPG